MSLVLLRVDERLIHGQVVVGWGSRLHPDAIVVVDDEIARSEWERELYAFGVPEGMAAEFFDVDDARRRIGEWRGEPRRIILLTRDVETMARLAEDGRLSGMSVNIGGLHAAPGRREALPYVHLGPTDEDALRRLADEGVEVEARDLPHTSPVPLEALLMGAREP